MLPARGCCKGDANEALFVDAALALGKALDIKLEADSTFEVDDAATGFIAIDRVEIALGLGVEAARAVVPDVAISNAGADSSPAVGRVNVPRGVARSGNAALLGEAIASGDWMSIAAAELGFFAVTDASVLETSGSAIAGCVCCDAAGCTSTREVADGEFVEGVAARVADVAAPTATASDASRVCAVGAVGDDSTGVPTSVVIAVAITSAGVGCPVVT